ncbi:MAG: hypothetical protein ACT4PQ_14480 [Betaproteobacteria bacterium]
MGKDTSFNGNKSELPVAAYLVPELSLQLNTGVTRIRDTPLALDQAQYR